MFKTDIIEVLTQTSKVFAYLLWSDFLQELEILPTFRSIVLANISHNLFLVETHPKCSLYISK